MLYNTEAGRIKLHDAADFESMRQAGRLAAETLDFITPHVVPGISTGELDRDLHSFPTRRSSDLTGPSVP